MDGEGESSRSKQRRTCDLVASECYSWAWRSLARTNARTHALFPPSTHTATLSLGLQRIRHQRCMASASPPPRQPTPRPGLPLSQASPLVDFIPIPANRRVFRARDGGSVAARVCSAAHQWLSFRAARWLANPLHFLCLHRDPASSSSISHCNTTARPRGNCGRHAAISCPPNCAAEVVGAPCSSSAVTRTARCAMAIVCRPLQVRGSVPHGPRQR